ncbi:MAG: PDZ domain-containing protein, partial [Planctomycetes bacterium]|nr:PDZ domain-containing protein [Planctomycetota bacterium]
MNRSLPLFMALATAGFAQAQDSAPESTTPVVEWKLVQTGKDMPADAAEEAVRSIVQVRKLEEAEKNEDRGYLGIFLGSVEGKASVGSVAPDSGAEKAGLAAGDVILSVNEVKVADSAALIEALSKYKSGERVAIQAQRGEEQILFMVTLGKRPSAEAITIGTGVEVEEPVIQDMEVDPQLGGIIQVSPEEHVRVESLRGQVDSLESHIDVMDLTKEQLDELTAELERIVVLETQASEGKPQVVYR